MDVESLLLTSDSALKSRIVVLRKDKDDCVVLTSLQFFDTVDCGIVTSFAYSNYSHRFSFERSGPSWGKSIFQQTKVHCSVNNRASSLEQLEFC